MEKKYLSRDVVGKQVIDSNAIIIGNVKDVSFDMISKDMSLIITTKKGSDVVVDGKDIIAVRDVVLLNKPVNLLETPVTKEIAELEKSKAAQSTAKAGLCGGCGYQNDTTANFCIKCGSKLPHFK